MIMLLMVIVGFVYNLVWDVSINYRYPLFYNAYIVLSFLGKDCVSLYAVSVPFYQLKKNFKLWKDMKQV